MDSKKKKEKQKMSIQKKASVALVAVLIVALAIGVAYAWTDYTQKTRNALGVDVQPKVLLHDDYDGVNDNYNGENKDVYVENTGSADIYVRVKFVEYLQMGEESLLPAFTEDGSAAVDKANPDDDKTWPTHRFDDADVANAVVCDLVSHDYFKWNMSGAQKEYLAGVKDLTKLSSDDLTAFNNAAVGDSVQVDAAVMGDDTTTGKVSTVKAQTATQSNMMLLSEWVKDPDLYKETACWLLDTDGWAYWSVPLVGGNATNLLLDEVITNKGALYDKSIYHIDVQLQAATFNDLGKWAADGIKAVANPDNDIATVTTNGNLYIRYMSGDTIDYQYEEYVEGSNVYAEYSIDVFEGTPVATGYYRHAGNDGVINTDDDNMLAGRSLINNGGIEITDINVEGEDVTKWSYKIKNASEDFYVTAGMDKKLGTNDDVIRTATEKLGMYDHTGDGNADNIGWNYLYGPLDNMLVATEYVFENVKFNSTLNDNGYKYVNSGVHAKMKSYWTEFAMDEGIVKTVDALDMSTDSAIGINVWICPDPNHAHGTNGTTCSSASTYKFADYYTSTTAQADMNLNDANTRFFALSLQEIDKAYGACEQTTTAPFPEIQRLRTALTGEAWAGKVNDSSSGLYKYNGFLADYGVYTSPYWLRSPGYVGSRAASVHYYGHLDAAHYVTSTNVGVRPACYLNLQSN